MSHLAYLLILAACLLGTLPLELVVGVRVYRQWQRLVATLLPVVVVFTAWDLYAIDRGLWNYDSHYLRDDLGTVPNIEDRGSGWGYQLEAEARYDFTPNWSAGGGVRYWHVEAGRGNSEFVNFGLKVPLNDYTSERFGVFGDVTYRFATF